MPKAAVNKNADSLFWKREIGAARQGKVASPSRDSCLPKNFDDLFFRGDITLSSNSGHEF
jgi:hypothetical protein